MLYFIFGTEIKKRALAREKIWKEIGGSFFLAKKIDKTNFQELPGFLQQESLFGEKLVIELEDLLTLETARNYLYGYLEAIRESKNIFILDEPFALSAHGQKVLNLAGEKNSFEATEKKVVLDLEPARLCNFLEERKKKEAWLEWKKIYAEWENEEEQFLQAALWYRWKTIWSAKLEKRNTTWDFREKKSRAIKYSLEELEKFGKEISLMAMKSNNGELDLMREIERLILKI